MLPDQMTGRDGERLPHKERGRAIVNYLTSGRRKVCEALPGSTEGMQMRIGIVGLVVVIAIGLILSVAAMSKLVPLPIEEISSTAMLDRR
jgi:hypothetical protein